MSRFNRKDPARASENSIGHQRLAQRESSNSTMWNASGSFSMLKNAADVGNCNIARQNVRFVKARRRHCYLLL